MTAKIYQIITVLESQRITAWVVKGDFKDELLGIEKEAANIVKEWIEICTHS